MSFTVEDLNIFFLFSLSLLNFSNSSSYCSCFPPWTFWILMFSSSSFVCCGLCYNWHNFSPLSFARNSSYIFSLSSGLVASYIFLVINAVLSNTWALILSLIIYWSIFGLGTVILLPLTVGFGGLANKAWSRLRGFFTSSSICFSSLVSTSGYFS